MCTCICWLRVVLVRNVVSLISPTDIAGSEVVVPGGDGPPLVVLVRGWHWGAAPLHLAWSVGILCALLFCEELAKEEERQGRQFSVELLTCSVTVYMLFRLNVALCAA